MTTKPKTRIPLYTLHTTLLISATGDAMAAIAIPWFVLQTTGSAAKMGIAAFFSITPIVIAMIFGGTIVDRVGYKQVSVLADFASGITMALIPLLHITIGLEFWQLLALVFLGNLLDAPGRSARRAMLPEIAEVGGTSIDRATGLTEAISRATGMLGAPIAGILIGLIGAAGVLMVNAATFLISAFGILLFIPLRLVDVRPEAKSKNNYWDDMRDGFQFIRKDDLLLMFIIVIMVTNMIDMAMSGVTLPILAEQVYGEHSV